MKRKGYRFAQPFKGMEYTITAPWHKCATLKNITADYRAVVSNAETLDQKRKALAFLGHDMRRRSTHAGYLPTGVIATVPYRGRFGDGKIIIQHYDRTHVIFEYWLLRREPGHEEKA